MSDRKFPIGPFVSQPAYTPAELGQFIDVLKNSPAQYRRLVENLSPDERGKTYRDGSWTVQQLVHHVADIQLLHYFRLKKALTEPDYETATAIDMNAWAATYDGTTAPIEDSLLLLDGVHRRYTYLAESLDSTQLAIQYYHPGRQVWVNQGQALAMSAWHVTHHLAHIRLALAS